MITARLKVPRAQQGPVSWKHRCVGYLLQQLQRDRRTYYGEYFACDHPALLFAKNLLRPQRIWTRVRYGQAIPLPARWLGLQPCAPTISREARAALTRLQQDGVVILPGRLALTARALRDNLELRPDVFEPASGSYQFTPADEASIALVTSVVADPLITSVLGHYYGCEPQIQAQPGINVAYPNFSVSTRDPRASGFPSPWHYDYPNELAVHMLLSDVTCTGTRMQVAAGTHNTPRVSVCHLDAHYSDEYVRTRHSIIDCVGPLGTVVIVDTNAIHRACVVNGSFRAHLHLKFTPGNDSLLER